MRILITGASGFIGSAITARLRGDGHDVWACFHSRNQAQPLDKPVDFGLMTTEDWVTILNGVEIVINCVGVLQDSLRDSTAAAHSSGPTALFQACEQAGVRRVIHFSAAGADKPLTAFSESKLRGDEALMRSSVECVILRPSVVVGPSAYGSSALFRGLAALPVLPQMPATGPLQVVQLSDVVETVVRLLPPKAPNGIVIELVGPDRLTIWEVVAAYRAWLGWSPQPTLLLPAAVASVLYLIGDVVGWLGWRPPLRSTARVEIERGGTGNPAAWIAATGIRPKRLADALEPPASVQERWFAKLYFLRPLLLAGLALYWTATGLISLGPGWQTGIDVLNAGGVREWAPAMVVAGALADIGVGIGIAFRRFTRHALWAGILLSLAYAVIGTAVAPQLWRDPLGPMLKIWPIVLLMGVALAIEKER